MAKSLARLGNPLKRVKVPKTELNSLYLLRIRADMTAAKGATSDHVEYTPSMKNDPNPMVEGMPVFLRGLTPEERQLMEKKLVRKIDTRLLIMIVIMYILNYLDRNNIAAAKLAGLQKDLKLRGDQYQVKAYLFMARIRR